MIMKNWLVSLKNRTDAEFDPVDGSFVKALNVILPIFIYYTVDIFLIRLGAVIIKLAADHSAGLGISASLLTGQSEVITVVIKLIAVICAAIAVSGMFEREKPVIVHRDSPYWWYLAGLVLGMSGAVFFNIVFTLTGLSSGSDTYKQVYEHQHSLSLLLGILVYGLITPLTEEIVFRGIVYNRMRRFYGLIIALILNPLIFGLYHGNIVQAVYGTVLGLLITWSYERFGAFVIPYIIHASANVIVYIIVSLNLIKTSNALTVCIITGVIIAVTLIFMARAIDHNPAK